MLRQITFIVAPRADTRPDSGFMWKRLLLTL